MKALKEKHGFIALGCWTFGGKGWGHQDDKDSLDALEASVEAGWTHWDTAAVYGKHHSERLCAQVLKRHREKIFLATKGFPNKRPEAIIESLYKSLECLGTDYIDLFYIHWPAPEWDMRRHFALLEKEREKGTLRAIGVSNFSVEDMQQVSEVGRIDAHQLCYSLYWRQLEKTVIPYCQKNDIAVFAYSPLAQGILTGKFPRQPQFIEGDNRPNVFFFQKDVWPKLYVATEKLKHWASEQNCPVSHLALQWLSRQEGIDGAIIGVRNPQQIQDNQFALNTEITPSVFPKMTQMSDELHQNYPPERTSIFRA